MCRRITRLTRLSWFALASVLVVVAFTAVSPGTVPDQPVFSPAGGVEPVPGDGPPDVTLSYGLDIPIPPANDIRTAAAMGFDGLARLVSDLAATVEPGDASWEARGVERARDTAESGEQPSSGPQVERHGAGVEPRPRVTLYTVREGDTLWDIAQSRGISVNTLLGVNPEVSPSRLQVGQSIRILTVDGALHVVKPGDTLSAIAGKYQTDIGTIMEANGLDNADSLVVGTELILPGATPLIVHRATVASTAGGGTREVTGEFRWPVYGTLTSRFGWRWGRFHHGIDIAAAYGRVIVASRPGKVTFAGWNGGYGYCVIVSHGDGVTTLYAHASKLLVSYGQWVEAGQSVARVGSTGYSTGNHCHFEIRVNGVAVNPLDILP